MSILPTAPTISQSLVRQVLLTILTSDVAHGGDAAPFYVPGCEATTQLALLIMVGRKPIWEAFVPLDLVQHIRALTAIAEGRVPTATPAIVATATRVLDVCAWHEQRRLALELHAETDSTDAALASSSS
jgi:hypothetical protein